MQNKDQISVRRTLADTLHHSVDPTLPFIESLQAKTDHTIMNDINMTNLSVSLFIQPNGAVEYFYNPISTRP